MDFDLSDDQRLLKDSVDRLLADRYGPEARRAAIAAREGYSVGMWAMLAELGLLGLPFAEAQGGFGGGPVETMIVMESFGRALVVEPFFSTVVLAGGVLRRLAGAAVLEELVPAVAAGHVKLALAQHEAQARWALNDVRTTAQRDGDRWRIDGEKSLVLGGGAADRLLVTARTAGGERDRGGIGVFLVDASDAGVSRRAYPTQDGMRAAEIAFAHVPGVALGDPEDALPSVELAVDAAIAALCAEAVGCMTAMQDMTMEYLKSRKQFGRAIGEFQALQHRAVDMYVSLEMARSMAYFATMMAEDDDLAERQRAIHAAKVQIGKSGRHIGQEAIQLHGGIGVTMEYALGHYFRRMTMIERSFGDTDEHLVRLARLGGLVA